MKNKLALIVAVVLGLIAVYGVRQYIVRQEKKLEQTYKTVRVAAAAERIKAGTVIRPAMLSSLEIPESAVSADHILANEADRLIGQTITRTVERGESLLASYFRQPVEKLEQKLRAGERAITLKVDAITGVAGNITPGSHVDIIGTFPTDASAPAGSRTPSAPTGGIAASRTVSLLSNVTVIAVDSRIREEEYVVAAGGTRVKTYSSITVAVTPEEANLLVYAQQYGTLTMALRNPADSSVPAGQMEIDHKNLLQRADQAQKARTERMRSRSFIETVPAEP